MVDATTVELPSSPHGSVVDALEFDLPLGEAEPVFNPMESCSVGLSRSGSNCDKECTWTWPNTIHSTGEDWRSSPKVHFASLMDLGHLKNAEWETKHQKCKGRVVLRGDIVKDDSGSYAVFTEQGSSASQMTAQRSWISSPDYQVAQDKQLTQCLLNSGQNGRCSKIIENS